MVKKKFDKKNAAHFQLVHRSRRDPLADDPDSSQLVLKPFVPINQAKRGEGLKSAIIDRLSSQELGVFENITEAHDPHFDRFYVQEPSDEEEEWVSDDEENEEDNEDEEDDVESAQDETLRNDDGRYSDAEEDEEDDEESIKEVSAKPAAKTKPQSKLFLSAQELGLSHDGYDYDKHMKPIGAGGGVFYAAVYEEEQEIVPMKPDLDKDPSQMTKDEYEVYKALMEAESDDQEEGDFDDDFVAMANQKGADDDSEDEDEQEDDDDYMEHMRSKRNNREDRYSDEEEEEEVDVSHIPRTEKEKLLDDQFDRVMQLYDDDEIGELDEDDPTARGNVDMSMFEDVLDDYIETHIKHKYEHQPVSQMKDQVLKERLLEAAQRYDAEDEVPVKQEYVVMEEDGQEEWDAETILSTYSNLDNHPAVIGVPPKRIQLSKKLGIPLGVLDRKPDAIAEEDSADSDSGDEDDAEVRTNFQAQPRPKDETPEERKERKKRIKEERRANRQRKKQVKEVFKTEEKRQARGPSRSQVGDVRKGTTTMKL
eukprot:GILK01004572.1.p1 GENE.GILK01004572.1~~GILK01004572.1.p1  ORF type:complete len:537 (+),score=138.56 GILK01004572.1:57-1667(+)